MHRRPAPSPTSQPDIVSLAAATWLACGVVLLGLTPLPLRDANLGWSPAFWLLVAPCLLLLARRLCVHRPASRFADFRKPQHFTRSGFCEKSGQGWPW